MRILIATPYLPWPLHAGGDAFVFSMLQCLAGDHAFTVVCPLHSQAGLAHADELQAQLPGVKIRAVYCGPPASAGAGVGLRLARTVVHAGRRILRPPASGPKPGPYYPFHPLPAPLINALQEELLQGPDLVQAEFAEMLPLGSWLPRQIPRIFVHHQIHFVYADRWAQIHGRSAYAEYLAATMQTQEVTWLREFSAVITVSEEDRRILSACVDPARVFASPGPIPADVGLTTAVQGSFDGRFLFLATEAHSPNVDALQWLASTVWPEIRRYLPDARLQVIGRWSAAAQAKYAAPGVAFSGFAADLASVLRGGIMLVPVRIGSGIRVKILAAMAQGVPVVSTSVGAEGLPVHDGEELLIGDTAGEIAAAAVRLAGDEAQRRRLAGAALAAVTKHYSPESVRRRRNEIYQTVMEPARHAALVAASR